MPVRRQGLTGVRRTGRRKPMETTGKADAPPDCTSAVTAASRLLAHPGIRFSPGQFAVGVLAAVAALALCIGIIFGLEGLAKAWIPIGLCLTVVIAVAVHFGRRASDTRREN